jgi:phosphoribosylformylglycinamidine synthase
MRKGIFYRFWGKVNTNLELCYYIEAKRKLTKKELRVMMYFMSSAGQFKITRDSAFTQSEIVEVGPQLRYASPWSDLARGVLKTCGNLPITRIEYSRRYKLPNTSTAGKFLKGKYRVTTEMVYEKPLTDFGVHTRPEAMRPMPVLQNGKQVLLNEGYSEKSATFWTDYFTNIEKRDPTELEVLEIKMGRTEHSTHPYMNSPFLLDGQEKPPLFFVVKKAWKKNPGKTVSGFADNASAIYGFMTTKLVPGKSHKVRPVAAVTRTGMVHVSLKVETHNLPTGVSPYDGAATGDGGMYRDIFAPGTGGDILVAGGVLCVSGIRGFGLYIPGEYIPEKHPDSVAPGHEVVTEGTDGLTRFGNEFGVPHIFGGMLSFEQIVDGTHYAYAKPICEVTGGGMINDEHVQKQKVEPGMVVVCFGNLDYDIGFGGGLQSSLVQNDASKARDQSAVQRGDGEYQNKAARVVRAAIARGEKNPFVSIHDLGAVGLMNGLKELGETSGITINIDKVTLGDPYMSLTHIMLAEAQERFVAVLKKRDVQWLLDTCKREKCNCDILGTITNTGRYTIIDSRTNTKVYDLPFDVHGPEKGGTIIANTKPRTLLPPTIPEGATLRNMLQDFLVQFGVASKAWYVHKVDRSVGGLIALQQCVGSEQIPVADAGITRLSYHPNEYHGTLYTKGFKPIHGLVNDEAGGRMSVMEALTNASCGYWETYSNITFCLNEIWPAKLSDEDARLYKAVVAAAEFIETISRIIGGKDSLSMRVKYGDKEVRSPGTLTATLMATMKDVRRHVTPAIKKPGKSKLLLIDMSGDKARLGGSALLQSLGQIGNECPDIDPDTAVNGLLAIQQLHRENLLLAMHDRTGDGLLQAINEMCMASNCGASIETNAKHEMLNYMFAEEAGNIIEYMPENEERVQDILNAYRVPYTVVGATNTKPIVSITHNGRYYDSFTISELRKWWQRLSFYIEKKQMDAELARKEYKKSYSIKFARPYKVTFAIPKPNLSKLKSKQKVKVLVVRDEGSNGDKEMENMFYYAGGDVTNVTMTDFLSGAITSLKPFNIIAFVGGFSNADVFGAGLGWAGVLKFHPKIKRMFDEFRNRKDTLILGVCNGCQMAAVADLLFTKKSMKVRLTRNKSGKFEHRATKVKIMPSPCAWTTEMEGSELYIPGANGEGVFTMDKETMTYVLDNDLAVALYIDESGKPTMEYPANPSGSPHGIAALTSEDGRVFIIMPHPERAWVQGTNPWKEGYGEIQPEIEPWFKIALNAIEWVKQKNAAK